MNLKRLLVIMDNYISYLNNNGMKFNDYGYPKFESNMFLEEEPDIIVPFSKRNNKRVLDKSRTVLCTFAPDREIYPRFEKLFSEFDIYKEYMGVVGADITFTNDMDLEWQKFISLLNQLYMAILAVNGIKILLNTRSAVLDVNKVFSGIPRDVLCVSGFLGCDKSDKYDYRYLSKILYLLPSKLLIYGKEDKNANESLDNMGINYKYYLDFHRICRKEKSYE